MSAKLTAETKQQILNMARQGMTDLEIVDVLQVSRSTVCKLRNKARIPVAVQGDKVGSKLSKAGHERRMTLYSKGLTDAALATALSVTKGTICEWRKRNGLPANVGQRKEQAGKMPKPYSHKPAPKGAMCGSCRRWNPSQPEPAECKQCDHREMWESAV